MEWESKTKKPMSPKVQARVWATSIPNLAEGEMNVLKSLVWFAQQIPDGSFEYCFGHERLAKDCSVSDREIRNRLTRLIGYGVVIAFRAYPEGKAGRLPNRYRINVGFAPIIPAKAKREFKGNQWTGTKGGSTGTDATQSTGTTATYSTGTGTMVGGSTGTKATVQGGGLPEQCSAYKAISDTVHKKDKEIVHINTIPSSYLRENENLLVGPLVQQENAASEAVMPCPKPEPTANAQDLAGLQDFGKINLPSFAPSASPLPSPSRSIAALIAAKTPEESQRDRDLQILMVAIEKRWSEWLAGKFQAQASKVFRMLKAATEAGRPYRDAMHFILSHRNTDFPTSNKFSYETRDDSYDSDGKEDDWRSN